MVVAVAVAEEVIEWMCRHPLVWTQPTYPLDFQIYSFFPGHHPREHTTLLLLMLPPTVLLWHGAKVVLL